jgi:O-antigen/teichoic acid export membrane protein
LNIKLSDVTWSYWATFLRIGSSIFLLPIILSSFSSQDVAVWSIFMGVTALSNLLDMGFNSSFVRNVSLVYSGVNKLNTEGIESISNSQNVNYTLLKDLIHTMKWFYLRLTILLFFLIVTLGTLYINTVLQNYAGNQNEVWISWVLLCVISSFTFYTQYLEVLLQGKGEVTKSKQIIVIGQIVYLLLCFFLIGLKLGLIAIILAQLVSIFLIRGLAYYFFFKKESNVLNGAVERSSNRDVLNAVYPNALKLGITSIGAFLVQRASLFMASLYFSLELVASYGITIMIINVLSVLSVTYTNTYTPKIVQLRVINDTDQIAYIYIKGKLIMFVLFMIGGILIICCGPFVLSLISSNTHLLRWYYIIPLLIFSLLENNHGVAGGILLSKNIVPFHKASLFAGFLTVVLIYLFSQFTRLGVWGIILGPGIAQFYQNWKWPHELSKDLMIKRQMYFQVVKSWKSSFLNILN